MPLKWPSIRGSGDTDTCNEKCGPQLKIVTCQYNHIDDSLEDLWRHNPDGNLWGLCQCGSKGGTNWELKGLRGRRKGSMRNDVNANDLMNWYVWAKCYPNKCALIGRVLHVLLRGRRREEVVFLEIPRERGFAPKNNLKGTRTPPSTVRATMMLN